MTTSTQIQYLKGIGPAKAKLFERLEIQTVEDLLHYYPRTYQDRRLNSTPNEYNSESLVVFKGRVLRTQQIPARSVLIFKAFLEAPGLKNARFARSALTRLAHLKKIFISITKCGLSVNAKIKIISSAIKLQ